MGQSILTSTRDSWATVLTSTRGSSKSTTVLKTSTSEETHHNP
jgi:hypothetical protein